MNEEEIYKLLGIRIKQLREKAKLSQDSLSSKAGISIDYLGKIEVCINRPGFKAIMKIANALNVPLKTLFDFDELEN